MHGCRPVGSGRNAYSLLFDLRLWLLMIAHQILTRTLRCLAAAFALLPLTALAGGPVGNVVNYGPADNLPSVYATGQTTVNVNGSTIAWSYFYDTSVVNVTGNANVSWMHLRDNAAAHIYDGTISWLKLYESSRANLTSPDHVSWLLLNDQSQAHLYGSDFSYGGGHISGKWANGVPFSFWALNEVDLANPESNRSIKPAGLHLHVVPEPVSSGLAVGALAAAFLLRRRK